jgi:transposase
MNPVIVHYVGVDIAKNEIEIACPALGLRLTVENTPKAIARWVKTLLACQEPVHILCEATGGYERTLLEALWAQNLTVSRLNPRIVRDFARAKGLLAKTDAIDAAVLADYGRAFNPAPTKSPSAAQRRLAELVARREDLKALRAMEANRLEHLRDVALIKLAKKLLRQMDDHLAQLERMLKDLVAAEADLRTKTHRLTQIKGVGFITAVSLLASLPELGSLSRPAAAALAGVAPLNRDSGSFRGQRRIQAGRPLARRALYMAALVASRRNLILSAFYNRLRSAGKPPKLALTALMRKLVILLNSLLKYPNFLPSC